MAALRLASLLHRQKDVPYSETECHQLIAGEHLPVDIALSVDVARVRKKPPHSDEDDEEQDHPGDPDNEAPETPTDEPAPVPIRDPPSHDAPKPPLTVRAA
jgi:hypothetical protein